MNTLCGINDCLNLIQYQTTDKHGLFIKSCCSLHIRTTILQYDSPSLVKLYKINQSNGSLIKRPNVFFNTSYYDIKINDIKPLVFSKKTNTQQECAICLDILHPNDTFQLAFCNHTFHKKCISKWCLSTIQQQQQRVINVPCRSEKKCPVCRGGIILVKNY